MTGLISPLGASKLGTERIQALGDKLLVADNSGL